MTWPNTAEDRLLQQYHEGIPGELLLEVPIGQPERGRGSFWIDGVLVLDRPSTVHTWGELTPNEIAERVRGRPVNLIEAKIKLNRPAIGQVVVGQRLLKRDYSPASIQPVVVCEHGHADLEAMVSEAGIEVHVFPGQSPPDPTLEDGRADVRRPPDAARLRAFLSGWTDAVNGQLYQTIRRRKTHMNMGNLFGWIYGDQPRDFRLETWRRYVKHGQELESWAARRVCAGRGGAARPNSGLS